MHFPALLHARLTGPNNKITWSMSCQGSNPPNHNCMPQVPLMPPNICPKPTLWPPLSSAGPLTAKPHMTFPALLNSRLAGTDRDETKSDACVGSSPIVCSFHAPNASPAPCIKMKIIRGTRTFSLPPSEASDGNTARR